MLTIGRIMSWNPCKEYSRERIEELFAGRESLTPQEIAALSIPAVDRLWVLLREEILPKEVLHGLACDFAERTLQLKRKVGREPHPAYWKAIEAKRAWMMGEIGEDELELAWYAPTRGAAPAARSAAYVAAKVAASYAAEDAEREWQLARVVEVLPERRVAC